MTEGELLPNTTCRDCAKEGQRGEVYKTGEVRVFAQPNGQRVQEAQAYCSNGHHFTVRRFMFPEEEGPKA